jgi:hypothetical protein
MVEIRGEYLIVIELFLFEELDSHDNRHGRVQLIGLDTED